MLLAHPDVCASCRPMSIASGVIDVGHDVVSASEDALAIYDNSLTPQPSYSILLCPSTCLLRPPACCTLPRALPRRAPRGDVFRTDAPQTYQWSSIHSPHAQVGLFYTSAQFEDVPYLGPLCITSTKHTAGTSSLHCFALHFPMRPSFR